VTIRAYCPCFKCCGRNADGKVAYKGWVANHGMIAISRDLEKQFPLGSRLYVPGFGWCWVVDRTAASRTNQIEMLFTHGVRGYPDEHDAAWHFPTTKACIVKRGNKAWVQQWPGYKDKPLRYMKTDRWITNP
jgi:3D (Asp-Asp-Asp) domain-containing protein